MTTVSDQRLTIRFFNRLADIAPPVWDSLARPLATPLLEWQWLHQMEVSGSIGPETGWYPCHLTVWSAEKLVGAAPLYIKTHSTGEFVFDHFWARIASEIDVGYYPKLVGMIPVTPAVGYRFLIAPDQDQTQISRLMLTTIDRFCKEQKLSGANFLFVDPDWASELRAYGYVAWRHQSFGWRNNNYPDFDAFLNDFNANQRRNIRRERRRIAHRGITLKIFANDGIPAEFIDPMYRFYSLTNARFGPFSCHYLTRSFFHGIYTNYRERLLFAAAFDSPKSKTPLAMSMLLVKGDGMIGRYWGCADSVKDLHFNTCYYVPMEWAIRNHISYFDPGAGSSHKIRRGFSAVANYSYHRFYHPRMDRLLRRHMDSINRLVQKQINELNAVRPFKQPEGHAV